MRLAFQGGALNLLLASIAFLLFMGSFEANELLDSFMLYAPGVSLIFIPAGVKLLCLLVGGWPAALGLFLSAVYLGAFLWKSLPLVSTLLFGVIGVGTYLVAMQVVMRSFGIRKNLSNLNYTHIIVLSLAASALNGFAHNVAYFTQGITKGADFLGKSTAMAFGDFLGCCVVVMLFNLCINAARSMRRA